MKFYEPPRGSPEAVNMSDDNSDGVSTDGGTPPEYNQTPAITYECIIYTSEDKGIDLYPYDSEILNSPNLEVITEMAPIEEPSSSNYNIISNQQLGETIESIEALRNRLNNYMTRSLRNTPVPDRISRINLSDTDSDISDHDSTSSNNSNAINSASDNIIENDPPPSPR